MITRTKPPLAALIGVTLVAVPAALVLCGVLFAAIFDHWLPQFFTANMDRRGQFGDSFGAVNAMFSGLAFAGVVVALIRQKQEFDAQVRNAEDGDKRRQSIALLEKWYHPSIAEARAAVLRFMSATEGDFDWAANDAQHSDGVILQMRIIIGYFEIWGRLVEAEQTDRDLLEDLLGGEAAYWKGTLIDRIANQPPSVAWIAKRMDAGLYFRE